MNQIFQSIVILATAIGIFFIFTTSSYGYYNAIPLAFATADKDLNGDGVTKYTTWEGKKINEKEYLTRMAYCVDMMLEGLLDSENITCSSWILTSEGETKLIDYILEENDIDTSEEKLDFWLDQLDN